MILLYVNDKLTDLNEDSIVSLQYQLNSPNDLSSFTTVYSTSLVLPLTSNNKLIFGYPTISTATVQDYKFRILRSSSIVDSGTLVVSSVTDDSINCNLFSSLVSLDHTLTYANGEDEVVLNLADFSRHGQMYDDSGTLVDIEDKLLDFKRSNFAKRGNGLKVSGSEGFIYFHPANIGCPSDFNSNTIYDGTNTATGQYLPVFSAPTTTSGAYQFRTYQLQPMIPMKVIFNNVLNNHNGEFFISMSNDVEDLIDTLGYTISKVSNLSTKSEEAEVKVITDATSHSTPSTLTATSHGIGVGYTLSRPTGGALHTVQYTSSQGYPGRTLLVHVITVSDGSNTWTEVAYPSQVYNKDFFTRHNVTIASSGDYAHDEADQGYTFFTTGLASSASTITVTSQLRIYQYTMHNDLLSLMSTTNNAVGSLDTAGSTSVTTYSNYQSLVSGAGSVSAPSITLDNYLCSVTNPWGIIKAVLKKFNIRIKHVKIEAGIPYYKLVFTNEYYDSVTYDLLKYLDFTDSYYNDHVFTDRLITFNEKPVSSAWMTSYSDTYNLNYGHGSIKTSYPVTSSSEWFANQMKYGISPNYTFYQYGATETTLIPYIFEAMDKDAKEIDISGCLVTLDSINNIDIALTDDIPDKQCYFSTSYLDSHSSSFTDIVYLTTVAHNTEQFLYNSGKRNPEGTKVVSLLTSNFKDVLDSASSRLFTCGVFINKLGISVYDFVTRVYTFLNRYWVVYSMKSYNPNSNGPTVVTFLRVNDLNNYIDHYVPPTPTTRTITITGDAFNDLVVELDGYEITEPTFTASDGQTVTVSTSFTSGYEFDRWNVTTGSYRPSTASISFMVSENWTGQCLSKASVPHLVTLTYEAPTGMPEPTLTGGGSYYAGDIVNITASAATTGYAFDGWYLNDTRISISPSISLVMGNTDVTYTAKYITGAPMRCIAITGDSGVADIYIELDGYEITYPVFYAHEGSTVLVQPSYNTGKTFDRWDVTEGTMQPTTSSFSFAVSEDWTGQCISKDGTVEHSVVLNYTAPTGMPAPTLTGDGSYAEGVMVNITASNAPTRYAFDGWYLDGVRMTVSNDYSFTMGNIDVTYTAKYISATRTIAITGDAHNDLYIELDGYEITESTFTAYDGQVVMVSTTFTAGYEFDRWNVTTGTYQPTTASMSFTVSEDWTGQCLSKEDETPYFTISGGHAGRISSYFTICGAWQSLEYESDDEGIWRGLVEYEGGAGTASFIEKCKIRGKAGSGSLYGLYIALNSGAAVSATKVVSGNIMTLVDYENYDTVALSPNQFYNGSVGFFNPINFSDCKTECSRLELPATTLATNCYRNMFCATNSWGSPILIPPTSLPATSLAEGCYYGMFQDNGVIETIELPATTLADNCYAYMFSGCKFYNTAVPPTLPATTLASDCYYRMFYNCTTLTSASAPALPATTLAQSCYDQMFTGCTNLTSAPVLPATTLAEYCYNSMFTGCTNLQELPSDMLPATTLSVGCYASMFSGCTSLTSAPALPATTLAERCYASMFTGCTSLVTTPTIIPAISAPARCCDRMFYMCRNITSAPALPATHVAEYCYYDMFWGCWSLITPPPELPATNLAESCYEGMFSGCSAMTSTPTISAIALAPSCCKSMFNQCANITTAPVLHAVNMAKYCYDGMFYYCMHLIQAPALPATTLVEGCYENMFRNCYRLTGPVEILAESPYSSGTTSACSNMFTSAGTSRPATPTDYNKIKVANNVELWDDTNCGIDPAYWEVEEI